MISSSCVPDSEERQKLLFNRISVMDVDTGFQMAAFGYDLEHCDEVVAALMPDFQEMVVGQIGDNGGLGEVGQKTLATGQNGQRSD